MPKKDEKLRPSQVFATRLREIRNDRKLTQADLAEKVTAVGRPLTKTAIVRIERGERGLSLDEALALIHELYAVPAHLLTPRDGELVWFTDNSAVDGGGMRGWLRYGDSWIAHSGDLPDERRMDLSDDVIVRRAQTLLDAVRGGDTAGRKEALRALGEAVLHREQVLEGVGHAPDTNA